ncbi:MAG: DUF4825 domain-containing protein [Clostridiales bacterium]|nr:DUF4825 domain-containing protein [Clostridiales bacterium]
MENIFLTVVKMSISASVVATVILIIRWLLGNKLHKTFSYALWAIVFIRLVLPFSIPSMVSIFNKVPMPTTLTAESKNYTLNQNISRRYISTTANESEQKQDINNEKNYDFISAFNEYYYDSHNNANQFITFMSYLWLLGVLIVFGISIFAYLNIYNKLQDSVIYKNDGLISQCKQQIKFHRNVKVYTSDKINTPLVCGLLKPRIILPLEIINQCSKMELSHFLCHELVHIKRFDYIIKPLTFLALSIHWFNPLMWFSYILAQKDMELSCDATVLSLNKEDIRKSYANSLINIATKQNVFFQAGLLAFGEKNIKSRVKGIMKFKRTKLWMSIIGIVIIVILSLLLLTNGKTTKNLSLSRTKSKSYSAITNEKLLNSLLEHRLEYVGNASNTVNLLRKLPYGNNNTTISLSTEKRPYGITANYSFENSSNIKDSVLTQNALLIFSLIKNVDTVTFNFENPSTKAPITYNRPEMQKYFEKDLWSYSKDKETFDQFFIDISTKLVVYPETFSLTMSSVIGMEIELDLDSYYKKSDFNITFFAKNGSIRLLNSNKTSEVQKTISNPDGKVVWFPTEATYNNDGDIVTITIVDKSGKLLVTKKLNITKKNAIHYKAEAAYDIIFSDPSSPD